MFNIPGTEAPPPSPVSQPMFTVTTCLLYGIFGTLKSFVIGKRQLVAKKHTAMLAVKTVGPALPKDVVRLITKQLYTMMKEDIQSRWDDDLPNSVNTKEFDCALTKTPAARAASRELRSVPVMCKTLSLTRPDEHISVSVVPEPDGLVHLSMNVAPSLHARVPRGSPYEPSPTGRVVSDHHLQHGIAFADTHPTRGAKFSHDSLQYNPNLSPVSCPTRAGNPEREDKLHLLVECFSTDESKSRWDAEAIMKFVDLLNLELVSFTDENPLQPKWHIGQSISYFYLGT